jgi:hypothetical protein
MAQNTIQSTGVLYPEDEIVYIADYSTSMVNDSLASLTGASWTNIGALTEFSRESAIETTQPPSVNVEHEQQVSKMAENINLTIQELNMTNYNKLMGSLAQAQTVAGSSTAGSDSHAAGIYSTATDQFVKFKNQSWSSTSASLPISPTSIVVIGTSTYVLTQDYNIGRDANGDYGIFLQSTGAYSSTQALTINYDYVKKAQSILWHGGADKITPCMLKVYSLYADGRTITAYYPRVEYVSGGAITDKSNGSGEYKDMKFSLQAREHEYFTYNSKKQYKIEIQTTA